MATPQSLNAPRPTNGQYAAPAAVAQPTSQQVCACEMRKMHEAAYIAIEVWDVQIMLVLFCVLAIWATAAWSLRFSLRQNV